MTCIIQKWLAKDLSFIIYSVKSPTLLPNGHLYDSAELFNSHFSDIKKSSYTLLPNVETYSNMEWNLSHHSMEGTPVEGSVKTDSKDSTKSTSLDVQSACSKPYESIRDELTSSPFDMSFVKFGLPKSKQTRFKDLSVTNQYDLLVKYTAMFCKVINIDDKVHFVVNHGSPEWADRGVDTCIPWQVNMPCPFNTYNMDDKQITFCMMPKDVYEDR